MDIFQTDSEDLSAVQCRLQVLNLRCQSEQFNSLSQVWPGSQWKAEAKRMRKPPVMLLHSSHVKTEEGRKEGFSPSIRPPAAGGIPPGRKAIAESSSLKAFYLHLHLFLIKSVKQCPETFLAVTEVSLTQRRLPSGEWEGRPLLVIPPPFCCLQQPPMLC